MKRFLNNRRKKTRFLVYILSGIIACIYLGGMFVSESMYEANFQIKNTAPSLNHLFGTDFLGRDMLFRTWKGLCTSLTVGFCAACISACIALVFGIIAGLWKTADRVISWLTDLFLAIPHLILVILISIALGTKTKFQAVIIQFRASAYGAAVLCPAGVSDPVSLRCTGTGPAEGAAPGCFFVNIFAVHLPGSVALFPHK